MAGATRFFYGKDEDDKDSLPCAAPTPLPPPPPQVVIPDPEVVLTPERVENVAKVSSGILRLHRPGKPPRRQVHFSLESVPVGLQPPKKTGGKEAPVPPEMSPQIPVRTEKEPEAVSTPAFGLLAAPIPNSSLAIGAEVQAARTEGFDAWQAAEELVQRSFRTRCALEAKAGEGVNFPREQRLYQGLVSLQVPTEELLHAAVQEKAALVRHRPEGRQEMPSAGPDLLAFFNPRELFTETPFLEVEGLPALRLQARTRDPGTTFSMDRKLRQWDT
ncbi:protein phosphatase 1 regulatory subunit 35 [Anolis carolinensis]|uniref:protein phosphatase 1 regulatory subunit 35 n=1 Tax=Anolis carolinensis TaxID=28377 RepID=UPI002F2B1B63